MKSRTIELGDFTVSRHAAALRALLATYRIETPQNALERIAPAVRRLTSSVYSACVVRATPENSLAFAVSQYCRLDRPDYNHHREIG
jgi:hypothetical protein